MNLHDPVSGTIQGTPAARDVEGAVRKRPSTGQQRNTKRRRISRSTRAGRCRARRRREHLLDSSACLSTLLENTAASAGSPRSCGLERSDAVAALANNELHYGLQWARGVSTGIKTGNLEEYQESERGLTVLEARLSQTSGSRSAPTIADLACYPTSPCHRGGFKLESYPAVQAGLKRVEACPAGQAM